MHEIYLAVCLAIASELGFNAHNLYKFDLTARESALNRQKTVISVLFSVFVAVVSEANKFL